MLKALSSGRYVERNFRRENECTRVNVVLLKLQKFAEEAKSKQRSSIKEPLSLDVDEFDRWLAEDLPASTPR